MSEHKIPEPKIGENADLEEVFSMHEAHNTKHLAEEEAARRIAKAFDQDPGMRMPSKGIARLLSGLSIEPNRGVVARINFKPARGTHHTFQSPIATDVGRPCSNIRLRMLQPRITSVFWVSGSRDRSQSPIIVLYLKKVFSTLPCL